MSATSRIFLFFKATSLLTLLPVSVSAMGVREAGMVLFLQPAGVAVGPAVTVAFLWFCVQTAGGLCGAGVYLFTAGSKRGRSSRVGPFVTPSRDNEASVLPAYLAKYQP